DQKVSWHATPFEERLEKALSEEGGSSCLAAASSCLAAASSKGELACNAFRGKIGK
ncbi:hypothetical protein Dimus_036911, partial [Dionaea muscipula]